MTLALIGSNGDRIEFDNETYIIETGLSGFGIPDTALRIEPSAGDGGVFRNTKRNVRQIDMPIAVIGSDRLDTESKLRRLANVLRSDARLIATYESGASYELVVYHAGGGDTQYGNDAGVYHCRWSITLQAPQPFWTSVEPQSFSIKAATTTRGLLGNLSKLQVKTSQALGAVTIENVGDVPAPIVWQIIGPATNVSITLDGMGFQYTETITSADTITIDAAAGTVKNAAGVNKYQYLSAAPKLFSIPAGISTVAIEATAADTNTKISGYFSPRREVIH